MEQKILLILLAGFFWGCTTPADRMNIDFQQGKISARIECDDATVEIKTIANNRVLLAKTGFSKRTAGIMLVSREPEGWDFSQYAELRVEVKNLSDARATFWATLVGEKASSLVPAAVTLNPDERGTICVFIYAFGKKLHPGRKIVGMRGVPAGPGELDPRHIRRIDVFVKKPFRSYRLEISDIQLKGRVSSVDAQEFFPFIDRFGQFMHAEWPGKTHSERELLGAEERESEALKKAPDPPEWDRYGGWLKGPALEAKGFFYTTKYKDKWWLVDPDGRLFFSQGIDGVGLTVYTPVSFRENYFAWLPDSEGVFSQCWANGRWAPHGFYKNHVPFQAVNFGRANLIRKYGREWRKEYARKCRLRLKKWGINTMGNWTPKYVITGGSPRAPYVVSAWSEKAKRIQGSEGWWRKFPDPFDESFRPSVRKSLQEVRYAAGDPWCIGFFVDNEQTWGDELTLALATVASPAEQPVKIRLMKELKARYGTVQNLNEKWGLSLQTWQDFLSETTLPDTSRSTVKRDLADFSETIYREYFRISREEVKRIAPNQMYLGCRFSANMMHNRRLQHVAAQFCDVITYNIYNLVPAGFDDTLDKPVLIGEFHFGALDRGMFHTGLWYARDQQERANLYEEYVRYALRHPMIVGTHWFQFASEPTSGRSDGENFQIGFVDICDRPYPELVAAASRIGADMYRFRMAK